MRPKASFQISTPKHSPVSRTPSKKRYAESAHEKQFQLNSSRVEHKQTSCNKNIADIGTSNIKLRLPRLGPLHKIKQSISVQHPVSNKNKILIENLVKKLKIVEDFAVHKPELNEEYFKFIRQLQKQEDEYLSILKKKVQRFDSKQKQKEGELQIHYSPSNHKVYTQAMNDLRKVRNFAQKHQIQLYRKGDLSPNGNNQSRIATKLGQQIISKSANIRPLQTEEQEDEPSLDVSTYLREQSKGLQQPGRQLMSSKDRHALGVSYLKNSRRQNQRESVGQEKCKIRLVKEIIHHWKIDNRFINSDVNQ